LTDNEERKLQIKIAQLNAELQFYLATSLTIFAGSIAFLALGYQLPSDQSSLKILIFIMALMLLCVAGYGFYKLTQCFKAFKNLQ
jgi:hypothetical protein